MELYITIEEILFLAVCRVPYFRANWGAASIVMEYKCIFLKVVPHHTPSTCPPKVQSPLSSIFIIFKTQETHFLRFIIDYKGYSEKAMAPHSSSLAWKIPWTEEPVRLQSMLRVRHDWAASLSLFTLMHWRRKWQPTPVFLPGESQGWGSLVGCRLWGRRESDTTEVT